MRVLFTTVLLALGLTAGTAGLAQSARPAAAPTGAALSVVATPRLTSSDAETWLDGYLPYALKRGGIAGAVVVIVKDGKVLVEKGYGVADTKTGAPVDPAKTLFRPGSISKLFTWTAVMQLAEAGKIDLDADVNRYLDFTIPPFEGKPVTMRNLMTHTAGFEETNKSLINVDAKNLPTIEQALKRWVPTRIYAPGTMPAYSNYGATLAGYIVQRVSHQSFDSYVEDHIFKPLGMAHSSFRQPLPPALARDVSKGYDTSDAQPAPYEMIAMSPAGALAATGDDMAKFMIAHLHDGALGSARILSASTAQKMHSYSLPFFSPLNAMTLGFFEEKINGHRGIGHGGDTAVFHSTLVLFPDADVGIFLSLNSAGRDGASSTIRRYLFEGFADRYLPGPPGSNSVVDAKTAAAHAALLASQHYSMSRGSFSNFMAVLGLLGQATIRVNDDGTISAPALLDYGGAPRRYRETSPFVWDEVGGHGRLAAVVKNGAIVMWSVSDFSVAIAFLPTPASMSSSLLLPLLGLALAILAITLVAWPITAMMRRRYKAEFPLTGVRATAYRFSRLSALACIIALGGWIFIAAKFMGGLSGLDWLAKHDGVLWFIEVINLVAFGGGVLVMAWNLWVVFSQRSGWFAKLWSVLLLLATLLFLWVFYVHHMINLSTNY